MTLAEQLIEQGVELGLMQGMEQGVEQGIAQGIETGEILDKQNILIKQISRKFGISELDRDAIKNTTNPKLLDEALDIILFAQTREKVLEKITNNEPHETQY